jgi:hypothetical protein
VVVVAIAMFIPEHFHGLESSQGYYQLPEQQLQQQPYAVQLPQQQQLQPQQQQQQTYVQIPTSHQQQPQAYGQMQVFFLS